MKLNKTKPSNPHHSAVTVEGPMHTWSLAGGRRFLSAVLPFGKARILFRPAVFDARTGTGEQRRRVDSHVRAIGRDMAGGAYTPTPVSAGLRAHHRDALVVKGGQARLEVSPEDPLPLTDGHQRFSALEDLVVLAEDNNDASLLDQLLALPIPVTIHLDGEPQRDFVALQKGKPVDPAHQFSLKLTQGLFDDTVRLAADIARVLKDSQESPFRNLIRFDSRSLSRLPVTTLLAKSPADLSTSLVGLAKVGIAAGTPDAARLAGLVMTALKAVEERAPELLAYGMPLAEPSVGTKGSATMLVGVAVCLAYRLHALCRERPEDDDLDRLAAAARSALSASVRGDFSGQAKRRMMKVLAVMFLTDLPGAKHEDLPEGLIRLLAPSAFAVGRLPKPLATASASHVNHEVVAGPSSVSSRSETLRRRLPTM